MKDEGVLARVHLYGLFKALELLPTLDPVAAQAIDGRKLSIEFRIRTVGRARLHMDNGKAILEVPEDRLTGKDFSGKRPEVVLWFASSAHFNGMIEGKKQPLPLRGLRHLKFLSGPFGEFTGRLEHFLRPTEEQLQDQNFFIANTRLTAWVAFHALSEIGNADELANKSARYIPDGVIQLKVLNDLGLYVKADGGRLSTGVGDHRQPRCVLWFKDLKALNELLTGKLNTYTGIGLARMGMKGFIPMIDFLNPVLGRIPAYLG